MGWGSGTNAQGREVGYCIDATCDLEGCDVAIDRGLAYCCGGMHDGGEHGCGDYFCTDHLFMTGNESGESPGHFMCLACCDAWEAEHPDLEEVNG